MEVQEQEAFLEEREKKITNHIGKQLVFQQTERASLLKKLENQRNELYSAVQMKYRRGWVRG